LKHVAPIILFSPYFIRSCMQCLNMIPIYTVYFPYLPCYPEIMVWIWVEMLRHVVLSLVLAYHIDDSWMNSMEVAIHPLRCGSAVVLRWRGFSKVRCGGEGSVLHGVRHVLESAKDLLLGVEPPFPRTTCATKCPIWNGLLNKLVHSGSCLAGGMDYRFKCVTLGIRKVQLERVKCVTLTHYNATGIGFNCFTP
jgi:hypothetical protein